MSDTHFRRNYSVENTVLAHISDSDKIIHCGDFTSIEFYNFLNSSKKLIAVRGNNDHILSDILPSEKTFDLEGFKITVTHGHLCSLDNIHLKYSDSDMIIHGHTHHPLIEKVNEKLILNPGSLTGNRFTDRNSFMVLNIFAGREPQAKIFYVNKGA
jgi:hypothetical protein